MQFSWDSAKRCFDTARDWAYENIGDQAFDAAITALAYVVYADRIVYQLSSEHLPPYAVPVVQTAIRAFAYCGSLVAAALLLPDLCTPLLVSFSIGFIAQIVLEDLLMGQRDEWTRPAYDCAAGVAACFGGVSLAAIPRAPLPGILGTVVATALLGLSILRSGLLLEVLDGIAMSSQGADEHPYQRLRLGA